jgi:endogenous inhibitor of DNA gyrase (YacG/DUF329 family)
MPCPICKKNGSEQYMPFCSKRCADVDLSKWLRSDYRIAGDSHQSSDRFEAPDDMDPQIH